MKIFVSLTSIFQNQEILLKTLKTICNQSLKPDNCFLYLSEMPYLLDLGFKNRKLNDSLKKFLDEQKYFIQTIWCDNTGPYRKLLPFLKNNFNEDCLIITVDDDTEYDHNLIKNMVSDYEKFKCCISYRGFTMNYQGNLKKLNYEERLPLLKNNIFNFHTGKGGVLYHPSFFKKTKDIIFKKEIYKECCETGDDIWFNFMRIANQVPCYVDNKKYMTKDNTIIKNGLYANFNSIEKLNTLNIKKTVEKLIKLKLLKN